jgi:hypothetical protein
MSYCPRCGTAIASGTECRRCAPVERRATARAHTPAAGTVAVLRALEITIGAGAFLLVGYLLGVRAGVVPALDLSALGEYPAIAAAEFLIDPAKAEPPPPLEVELLVSDVIELRTGAHFDAPFEVNDPRPCTLTGHVVGLAGGRKDVEVYVLDDEAYLDWQHGIQPRALFMSGRASTATLAVDLPRRGRYHLLLSNRYSILTAKRVRVDDARLRCA